MAKALSLADKLAKKPVVSKSGKKSWYEVADKETMAELQEVRRRWLANEYQHDKTDVFKFCAEHLNLPVKRQAFLRWLEGTDEKPNG